MTVYELTHLFYRVQDQVVLSPKFLGLYPSPESARAAIAHYNSCPGFRNNQDGYSIAARSVVGDVVDGIVYEAQVYFHDPDYETEHTVELGYYGTREQARQALTAYCDQNTALLRAEGLEAEKLLNRCIIGKMEWTEGFTVSWLDSDTGELKETD